MKIDNWVILLVLFLVVFDFFIWTEILFNGPNKNTELYFFDVGLVNFLLKRGKILFHGETFGRAFEHFIFQELVAHSHYSGVNYPVSYWRTASDIEVDFILGSHEVAIEIKGVEEVSSHHLRGLRAFQEEYNPKSSIVVSLDSRARVVNDIKILPWQMFLDMLWNGEII